MKTIKFFISSANICRVGVYISILLSISFSSPAIPDTLLQVPTDSVRPQSLSELLLELRMHEVNTQLIIERLSVDVLILEKQWEDKRGALIRLGANAERGQGSLETQAIWQQLNTQRIELRNSNLRREFLEQSRMIGETYSKGLHNEDTNPNTWRNVIDTSRIIISKINAECDWLRQRIHDAQFEQHALKPNLNIQMDSLYVENQKWLAFRRQSLHKQIEIDSVFVNWGTKYLLPKVATFQRGAVEQRSLLSSGQRLRAIFSRLRSIWGFELYRVKNAPLTIGQIILALLVITIGLKLAQAVSKLVSLFIQRRFHIDPGIMDAGQKLVFYAFSFCFILYALYTIKVPLTAFTVAGGALALGIGFGSQNILNNFISGIILLAERPIKTGDFVEVESAFGTVESIGLRSTRIITPANVHLVLPNSSFLEKNVINWTLADRIVRLEIHIGVVYGSPIRDVKRLLLAAAADTERIRDTPEPLVIFSDFGDNALIFDLLFWIRIDNIIDRRTIQSALRFKVSDLFMQAGIVIAFPQRDVHLDTGEGIRVFLNKEPAPVVKGKSVPLP